MPKDANDVWPNEEEMEANGEGGAYYVPGAPGYVAPTDNTGRDIERGFNDVGRWFMNQDEVDRARAQEEDRIGRWDTLAAGMPSVDELSTGLFLEGRTDAYGNLLGGPSRLEGMEQENQQRALEAMGGLMEGGLTEADRAQIHAQRLQSGQRLGAANQAAVQQMGARGMGGSGAELAARMGGSQAMAQANAMGDASTLGRSQDRAFAAMQGYGQLSGQMYGQEAQRRAALDAYNQQQLDWRRGRSQRNTERQYRQSKDRAGAYQQRYGNQATATSGATNYGNQNMQYQQSIANQRQNTGLAIVGDVAEEWLG